ncbi:hypothetical protein NLI96_g5125 [Meripilus lineatus]|uniref:Autophagy-related protein n=1 Tax=Meripilus lineatus TaxID=2056292 RepID=A0AAD5V3K3_9APHY|nr:hypothetical protein NLI96_g5125 [Physisporinus lineatus]
MSGHSDPPPMTTVASDPAGVSPNKVSRGEGQETGDEVVIATIDKREPLVTRKSLATQAGWDPVQGPGSSCTAEGSSGQCVLPWAGGAKAVSSVVLVANGVSFAVMTLIFTTIGSAADYGTFGKWLLFVVTVICWAAQFASMSLTTSDRWGLAMALYMIGFITYGATLVFYAAIFPRLARNTPHARQLREKYENGEIPVEEYEVEESLEKNRISNISYIVTLALNLSLLLPLMSNSKVDNYVIVFYFPGATPGSTSTERRALFDSWLETGIQSSYDPVLLLKTRQIWIALKQYKKLPYTFTYLFAFFLLADFVVTNVVTILIPLWGMIGIWTTKFGFHNVWEFWAYNVVFGLFQAPYYAFSQTMMAELTPPGFDNMFFGLFGLSNRASSMIGPNVIQAIIDNSGNNWKGFPFLFALCVSASIVIWFGVDVTKGRREAVAWAEKHRAYAQTGLIRAEVESVDSKDLIRES